MKTERIQRAKRLFADTRFWSVMCILGFMALMNHVCSSDTPIIRTNIGQNYYYTYYTSGHAVTTTLRFIALYKKRNWWFDKKIADFNIYANSSVFELTYHQNRLTLCAEDRLLVDTVLQEDKCLEMDYQDWPVKGSQIKTNSSKR